MVTASDTARAHRTLLPFFGAMVGGSALIQLAIALTGNRIGLLAGILTAVLGVGFALYLWRFSPTLGRVRYGVLVAHVCAYVAVNVGFGLHAYLLIAVGSSAILPADPMTPIDPGWLGATLAMSSFWGLGLLLHLFGALMGRGFEAPTR